MYMHCDPTMQEALLQVFFVSPFIGALKNIGI